MNIIMTLLQEDTALFESIVPYLWLLPILSIWSLVWKGLALWRAAMLQKPYWFVALLVINTFGIFEIIYLLTTQKKATGKTISYE